jgi:sugar phosphate isomerase/epimerase
MPYPIGFSTLGCPKWPWLKVLDQASALGYLAIEIRGIEGEMDLAKRPEFSARRLADTRRELADRQIAVSDLGASAHLHERNPTLREKQLDEARRFIDLAHDIGARWVRVFPNGYLEDEAHDVTLHRIGETLAELGWFAKGSGVGVLMESHGELTDSASLVSVMRIAETAPGTGLVWDTHHTVVTGGEAPADTWKAIGKWVRHTHIKDSIARGDDRHYVLLGQGTVGVHEIVRTLAAGGYDGVYNLEWEKVWHPDIDEPEVAIPQYAETMKTWLQEAGVKQVA